MIAFFTHAFVSPTSSAFFALFSCQFLHLLCQQSSNQFTWHINCEICTSTKTHHTAKKQSFQYLANAGCEHLLYFLQLRIEYHLLIGMTQSMAILSRVASEWIKYQANVLNWYYTITISVAVLKPFSFITFRYYHKTSKSRLRQKNEKVENCVEEIVLLLLLSLLFTTIT